MKLKIGAHVYTVKKIPDDLFEDCGKTDKEKKIIYINKNLTDTEYLATLIHECLHVINSELTETDTEFLAQAFTQLLLENMNTLAYNKHSYGKTRSKKPRKKKGK